MFKAEMKISSDSRKIISNTKKLPLGLEIGMHREMVNSANRMRNDILLSMKKTPKTGRIYKKSKTVFHQASSPGYPPAIDDAFLSDSITTDITNEGAEVGSEEKIAAYGGWLEEGVPKNKLEPRPFLEPAKIREEPIFEKNINKVIKDNIKGLDK